MGNRIRVTPSKLLRLWEREHGDLELDWSIKFLQHKDVPELLEYSEHGLRDAIKTVKQLDDLLKVLKPTGSQIINPCKYCGAETFTVGAQAGSRTQCRKCRRAQ